MEVEVAVAQRTSRENVLIVRSSTSQERGIVIFVDYPWMGRVMNESSGESSVNIMHYVKESIACQPLQTIIRVAQCVQEMVVGSRLGITSHRALSAKSDGQIVPL